MVDVRVVELPACTMASSGTCTDLDCFAPGGLLATFNDWWSAVDASRADRFFPRDFMWYDDDLRGLVWWYALSGQPTATGTWQLVDFAGGLYATATCRDGDDADGERVSAAVRQWVRGIGGLELDEARAELFHVITPPAAAQALGYQQLELFVPVRPAG
ncbi:MAG: GyrI-like domain-containing protein [Propionicimonas sp.]|nr:GyrI-like domain-containing protein [Propionicimonas sp.]